MLHETDILLSLNLNKQQFLCRTGVSSGFCCSHFQKFTLGDAVIFLLFHAYVFCVFNHCSLKL
jgi:hypothetical protein